MVTLAKAREEGGEADETVVLMDETKHDENIMMNQESESEKKRAKQAKAAQMRAKAMSMVSNAPFRDISLDILATCLPSGS